MTILTVVILSSLTILACAGESGTPTAPTVAETPIAAPAPAPTPPAPTPTTTVPDEGAPITVRGVINRMTRSGPNGIDVLFRIGNEPWVRGDAATIVIDGSFSSNTSALRDQQTVTIDGRQRADHVYAKTVTIDAKP